MNVVVKVSRATKDRIVDERQVVVVQLFRSVGLMDQRKANGAMRHVIQQGLK